MSLVNNTTVISEEQELLMEPWGYIMAAIVLALIGFFGFTLNLAVIIIMFKDVHLWTPMNIILFNLICSDFSVSIFGIGSITTLTVLSYERCYLVSCPFTTSQLSRKHAIAAVFFIWCYSFMLTSPPLFGWGKYVNEAANISCSVNWETQTTNATSYIIYLFAMGLIIPVTVISYSYTKIIHTMKKQSARLRKTNRSERLTWMVAVMIGAFMIAWTPYSAFALIEQFASSDLISPGAAVLPALFAKTSICYNPIIYVGMNTQYRSSWNKLFGLNAGKSMTENTMNHTVSTSTSSPSAYCLIKGKKERKIKRILTKKQQEMEEEDYMEKKDQDECEMSVMCNNQTTLNEDITNVC